MQADDKSEELVAVESVAEAMNNVAEALRELTEAIINAS